MRPDGCGRSNEDLECLGCGYKLGAIRRGTCPADVDPPPPVGSLVRVHHDHPFSGLCLGVVVESRSDRLIVEIRAPDYRGSRQDMLTIRPGQVTPIEVAMSRDRDDELARLRAVAKAARAFIDADRKNYRSICDSPTDPAFRAMERAVESWEPKP